MKEFFSTHKYIIIIITLFSLIFIALLFLSVKQAIEAEEVDIYINFRPDNSIIIIDNNNIKNKTTTRLSIGEHHIIVSQQGYTTYDEKINISKYSDELSGLLIPNDISNIDDYLKENESFINQQTQKFDKKISELYPIANYLPINNDSLFSYYYDISDDYSDFKVIIEPYNKIHYGDTVIIYSTLAYLEENQLTPLDLSIYNIEIKNFNNPFSTIISKKGTDPAQVIQDSLLDIKNSNNLTIYTGVYQDNYYYTLIDDCDPDHPLICNTYKIILQDNNGWEIIGTPSPILTLFNTNNQVPREVLYNANNYFPEEE